MFNSIFGCALMYEIERQLLIFRWDEESILLCYVGLDTCIKNRSVDVHLYYSCTFLLLRVDPA